MHGAHGAGAARPAVGGAAADGGESAEAEHGAVGGAAGQLMGEAGCETPKTGLLSRRQVQA